MGPYTNALLKGASSFASFPSTVLSVPCINKYEMQVPILHAQKYSKQLLMNFQWHLFADDLRNVNDA